MSDHTEATEPTLGEQFLFEAFTQENRENPYPLYDRMRDTAPVLDAGNHLWLTFDHASAHTLLRSRGTSSDERNATAFKELSDDERGRWTEDSNQNMLFLDPPDHTRLRSLVSSAFTPRTVDRLAPRIAALTDTLLDDMARNFADGGQVDLVEALAYPLPIGVICELLGVPPEDEAVFGEWSHVITQSLDPAALRSPEDEAAIGEAGDELKGYLIDLVARRRADPQDDLTTALLAAREGDDQLSEVELLAMMELLLIAGHETTVNLIGNGVIALLRNRDQLERWQGDPSLDKNAVDELLRYDSPVQMGMRVLLEDTEVGDRLVPAGDQVLTLLGSANRDPLMFDDPNTLDLSRANAARNLSFGGGIHHCLGMALARIEGQLALGGLVRRFPNLELAAEPELRSRFVLRGYGRIPVTA